MAYIGARHGDGAERFCAAHMHAIRRYLIPGAPTPRSLISATDTRLP
jgi:hypothetical protein